MCGRCKRKARKFHVGGSSSDKNQQQMEWFMRTRNVLIVTAIIILAIAVKLFVAPPKQAEAVLPSSMNVLQMHTHYPNMKNMPAQKMDDMSLVFSEKD